MDKNEMREVIAKRAAKELHDGDVVNLGIGDAPSPQLCGKKPKNPLTSPPSRDIIFGQNRLTNMAE